MKQKLIDLLNEPKYQKANLKIGSKSGSSFWYCGKGKLKVCMPEIRLVRKKLLKQCKGLLYQSQYRLEHLDEIYEVNIKLAKQKYKEKKIKDFDAYLKKMELKKKREIAMLPKKIKSLENDIKTDLFEREVVEVVFGVSPDEKPCWIIYVKGNEKGAYWTIAEYTKRRKIYDN